MQSATRIEALYPEKPAPITIGIGLSHSVVMDLDNLTVICGPCAIESRSHALEMAHRLMEICHKNDMQIIYKSCYDKDCRSSKESYHGIGLDTGLDILSEIRDRYQIPVTSDFSETALAEQTGKVVDLLQVPAYLCRQTSMLRAAAHTGKAVHVKKGQFMSPWNMKNTVKKLRSFGCSDIVLGDRGTFFGYSMLVNDFRSLPIFNDMGVHACYDATHSIQLPTSMGEVSGGQREFIPYLTRAAIAIGVSAIFLEVHDNPSEALSDPNTQLHIDENAKCLEN